MAPLLSSVPTPRNLTPRERLPCGKAATHWGVGRPLCNGHAGGLLVGQGCLGQRPPGQDLERDTEAVGVSFALGQAPAEIGDLVPLLGDGGVLGGQLGPMSALGRAAVLGWASWWGLPSGSARRRQPLFRRTRWCAHVTLECVDRSRVRSQGRCCGCTAVLNGEHAADDERSRLRLRKQNY